MIEKSFRTGQKNNIECNSEGRVKYMGRQKQKLYIGAVILFVVGMLLNGLLFELVYAGAESVPAISDGKTVSLTQEEHRYIEEHPEILFCSDQTANQSSL